MDAILSLQDLSVAAGNVGDAGQLEQNRQSVPSVSSASDLRPIPRSKSGVSAFAISANRQTDSIVSP